MGQSIEPKTVVIYSNKNGDEPFTNWLNRLRDSAARRRILARLRRLEHGNSCNWGGTVSTFKVGYSS